MRKCASVCVSCLHVRMSVDALIFAGIFACFYLYIYICVRVCVRMRVRFLSAPEGGSATLKQTEGKQQRGLNVLAVHVWGNITKCVHCQMLVF